MKSPLPSEGQKRNAWQKFGWSFVYAFHGFIYAVRTQRNLRIHLAISLIVLLAALFFHLSIPEVALVILAIMVVISAELFNTALEAIVDLVSPGHHHLARAAKDVAASGVLVCALLAVVLGLFLFLPHIFSLLFP